MIVQFSIENYKSFKDETVLSFIGSNTTKEHESDNTFLWKDYKFLKSNAIYGANASGKSNLLNAMSVMKRIVLTSFQNAISENLRTNIVQPFKLNTNTLSGASIFEVVFIQDGKQYRYGFEILGEIIVSEWLFHVPNKIESALFTRERNKITINKTQFSEGYELDKKLEIMSYFLSVCSQFNGEISDLVELIGLKIFDLYQVLMTIVIDDILQKK